MIADNVAFSNAVESRMRKKSFHRDGICLAPTPGSRDYKKHAVLSWHSGLTQPDNMGVGLQKHYDVQLKEHFLRKMRPELAQEIKKSCITWKTRYLQTCYTATILQYADLCGNSHFGMLFSLIEMQIR